MKKLIKRFIAAICITFMVLVNIVFDAPMNLICLWAWVLNGRGIVWVNHLRHVITMGLNKRITEMNAWAIK